MHFNPLRSECRHAHTPSFSLLPSTPHASCAGWEPYYVPYATLKKLLSAMSKLARSLGPSNVALGPLLEGSEVEFTRQLLGVREGTQVGVRPACVCACVGLRVGWVCVEIVTPS